MEPILVAEHVSKRYGKVRAVDDLSLTLPPGVGVGLVGPNGSGKSTLIKCLVGIIKPEEGDITVCGRSMTGGDPEAKRWLAYAPELPQTVPSFTPWDHLSFTAGMLDISGWEPEGERLLKEFDLWPKRNKLAMGFSKGEHQKVMLVMAFLRRPRILFLDEPLLGLDPRAALGLKHEVRTLVAAGGTAVICSHVLSLVEELCGMLAVMSRGKLAFVGSTEGLRIAASESPGSPLEEAFVKLTEPGSGGSQ